MNLAENLTLQARYRGDQPAIEAGGRVVAYRELDRLVRQSAAHLRDCGIRPGDVIGLCLQDTPTHLALLFAAARAGAVALPMDWRWTEPEQGRTAAAFGARLVLTEPGRWVPEGLTVIAVDGAWHAAVAGADAELPAARLEDAPMLLALSSGTTGEPKAAILTHEQYRARFHNYLVNCGLRPGDRYLSALPLSFSAGRMLAMTNLYAGGTVVLFPAMASADEMSAAVESARIATTCLVPSMIRALLRSPIRTPPLLARLRVLMSVGSGLHPEERSRIRSCLTGNLTDMYTTTGGGLATVLGPEEQEAEPASVGRPALGVELEIVDDEDRPLPAASVGRVRYRAPGMPSAYFRPVASADEDLRNGWCYPGDYAFMNERGYLFLQGRSSEIIKRGGISVFAPEVEAAILSYPDAVEAAVVGIRATDADEEIAAFVVSRGEADPDELDRHCRTRLAPYKVPQRFEFVPALPRNSNGKVVKPQLVALLVDRAGGRSGP